MDINNAKSQMRKGMLEYCILLLLKRAPAYASDIIRQLQEARKTSEFLSGLTDDPSYHRNKEVLARSVEELRLD